MNYRMRSVLAFVAVAVASTGILLSVSTTTVADEQSALNFKQRLYVNGGLGITRIEPESPTAALTVSDNSDSGGHLGIGLDLNRFLSVEAYVADLGTAKIDFLGTPAGTVDYLVFGASALGYVFNSRSGFVLGDDSAEGAFRHEGLSVYGRIGIGHMRNDSAGVESYRDYPSHLAFGAGLEYGFKNGFALRSELMGLDTDARYLNVGVLKRFGSVLVVVPVSVPTPAVVPPTVPEPVAPVVPKPIVMPFVYFEFDKSDLSPEAVAKLSTFTRAVTDQDLKVSVEGHTDWIASEAYNVSLSIRRAEAVANYLVSRGIDIDSITTIGYGESRPASNNNTAEGRQLNRRTEVLIQ